MKKTINKRFTKGFTLVELIIVITILAILATIAFISFQWYSKNARDWNRVSTLKNVDTWLQIYKTRTWYLPNPENSLEIISSWSLVWYQWYFWEEWTRLIQMSKVPLDPLDSTKITYLVNNLKTNYQLLTFLETSDTITMFNNVNKVFADNIDYTSRVPKTFWSEMWIILLNTGSNINRPLQEFKSVSFTWIDIKTYTWSVGWNNFWNLKVILKTNDELVWTWKTISIISDLYNYKKVNIPAWTKLIMSWCPSWWNKLWNMNDADLNIYFTWSLWLTWSLCESKDEILPVWSKVAMSFCWKWWKKIWYYFDGDNNIAIGSFNSWFSVPWFKKDEMYICEKTSWDFYSWLLIPIIWSCSWFWEKKWWFVDADGNVTFWSYSQNDVSVCLLK